MHAYRDAIKGVTAAVVLYPGNVSIFRNTIGQRLQVGLSELIAGGVEGIGAIPLTPVAAAFEEEYSA